MGFFSDLKQGAEGALATLKADAQSVEAKVEHAFHLGAMHAKFNQIEVELEAEIAKLRIFAQNRKDALLAEFNQLSAGNES